MNRKIFLCAVLMIFLAETSLLSADPQRARLTTQANVNPTLNNSNLASSYDNVTIHEGNLIIDGYQTFVIENCTYIQTGNVTVKDQAELIIRNAKFQMNQTSIDQYQFLVRNTATLELKNAFVESYYAFDFGFMDYSQITFDRLTLNISEYHSCLRFSQYPIANVSSFTDLQSHASFGFYGSSEAIIANSTISSMLPEETCHVQISNSVIQVLEVRFAQGSIVNVNALKAGFFEYFDFKQKVSSNVHDFDLRFNETSIGEIWLWPSYDSETEISNSVLQRFEVDVPSGIPVTVEGLRPGFYEYKKVGGIVLNQTQITKAIHIQSFAKDSTVTVLNCEALLLPGSNSLLYVMDSVVGCGSGGNFVGSLYFDNTTWTGDVLTIDSNYYICGNLSFRDFTGFTWQSNTVTREYNIIACEFNGGIIENATLTLPDEKGATVWNGTTDNLGQADFNLTFADNNYTDTLKLNVSQKGFYNETTDIGFLSDTPVSIVFTEKIPGDINLDREVSLADLVLLAQAYGSKPGDAKWNANADINGNGAVGLSDLVLLANHYGQHYP